jgi:hypothetical protein
VQSVLLRERLVQAQLMEAFWSKHTDSAVETTEMDGIKSSVRGGLQSSITLKQGAAMY